METLTRLSAHCKVETAGMLQAAAAKWNLPGPPDTALHDDDSIDVEFVDFLSRLAATSRSSLPDFVRLVRGETSDDPRPNKDLYEPLRPANESLQENWSHWNEVIRHGVVPEWLPHRPTRQAERPSNHGTLRAYIPEVWRHIRKGQKDGRYLVVRADLTDQWPEVFVSPIGIITKDDSATRLINDYSFPPGDSVNDYTDRTNLPAITYNPPADIARRICVLRQDHPYDRILLMLGDVAGAFRHVPIHADHVHMFAFEIDGFLVIDLSCGFGWCGSPAWYFLPGSLINGLYESGPGAAVPRQPPFHGSFWCDDHTCVERDQGLRCFVANLTLRRAMASILGPSALNERKFTAWSEQGRALGLDWDTTQGTVTIPEAKIEKGRQLLAEILACGSVSKTSLLSLLGSLRHIATCCPPARAFYQRVQDVAVSLGRYGRRLLPESARDDLLWFQVILQQQERFNRIPVEFFANESTPDVHVYMDASDQGLCALAPGLRQYIRVRFTPANSGEIRMDNSINVRELQSAVLAALIWGPIWGAAAATQLTHIRFWIDNASAVSWAQRRASRQPRAQIYNRLLSLAEFNYSLFCSASHIPGVANVMAVAGSRAWTPSDPLFATWTNLSRGWTQVPVQQPYDNLSRLWDLCSGNEPSLTLPRASTSCIGASGRHSHSS